MTALIVGTVLAIVVLAFVMAPVVIGVRRRPTVHYSLPTPQSDLPLAALREIEFDRATGKLSDEDYAALRERYANEALAAMRAKPASDDPIEAAVRAYRSAHPTCVTCGVRPEADAIYCSNCGSFLPGKCESCGITVTVPGVRFCIGCGHRLAA